MRSSNSKALPATLFLESRLVPIVESENRFGTYLGLVMSVHCLERFKSLCIAKLVLQNIETEAMWTKLSKNSVLA
jgi:hypothetical protein